MKTEEETILFSGTSSHDHPIKTTPPIEESYQNGTPSLNAIIVNSYENIFNYFDGRDNHNRSFNVDFLTMCRRYMKKRGKYHEIIIAVPQKHFDEEMNDMIRNRLKDEFKRQLLDFKRESVKKNLYAILAVLIGTFMIGSYGYLGDTFTEFGVWFTVFLDIMYVCGYFGIWGGCDILIFDKSDRITQWLKKSRLAHARITFEAYPSKFDTIT